MCRACTRAQHRTHDEETHERYPLHGPVGGPCSTRRGHTARVATRERLPGGRSPAPHGGPCAGRHAGRTQQVQPVETEVERHSGSVRRCRRDRFHTFCRPAGSGGRAASRGPSPRCDVAVQGALFGAVGLHCSADDKGCADVPIRLRGWRSAAANRPHATQAAGHCAAARGVRCGSWPPGGRLHRFTNTAVGKAGYGQHVTGVLPGYRVQCRVLRFERDDRLKTQEFRCNHNTVDTARAHACFGPHWVRP